MPAFPGSMNGAGTHAYWLGTDGQGRDLYSAMLYGLRLSLSVGLGSAVIAGVVGTVFGLVAAYAGGKVDSLIMRLVDLLLAFPSILVAMMLLAFLGKSVTNVVLTLVLIEWAYYARTARAQALVEARREYVEAARSLAIPNWRIVLVHILPNCLPPLIVVGTLQVARAITLEATLSFLGLGVPITEPSLGLLIANGYQTMLGRILDQRLSGSRAAGHAGIDQHGWRPPARTAQSEVREMSDAAFHDFHTADNTLEVRHLRTRFFTREGELPAVEDVSLTLARGRVLGLVGESGSGKSVTGFSIMGLIDAPGRVVGGEILFKGKNLVGLRSRNAAPARQPYRDGVPGPHVHAQSGATRRRADDRSGTRASQREPQRRARTGERSAGGHGYCQSRRTAALVSASAVGRYAPACGDSDCDAAQAGLDHRR